LLLRPQRRRRISREREEPSGFLILPSTNSRKYRRLRTRAINFLVVARNAGFVDPFSTLDTSPDHD